MSREGVSLQQVLDAFAGPISEEHAWALCHQGALCLRAPPRRAAPAQPRHLLLQRDGAVRLAPSADAESKSENVTEQKIVENLAVVVYRALDYAQADDEERLISPELERLINNMTSDDCEDINDHGGARIEAGAGMTGGLAETDDEGIERDSGEDLVETPRKYFSLTNVIERCLWHAGRNGAAHYQAVCRALVAESLELTHFLSRVKDGGHRDLCKRADAIASCKEMENLRFSDWTNRRIWLALQARFWMQVIGELRMGVKLKKVDFSRTPIEYELTPYEILMDDIRSRRYKLRKVDGSIPPRVKKDAHAMILEFIRSRPPLKKASERKLLPAAARQATPREQLLDSIKRGRPLKPTPLTRTRSKRKLGDITGKRSNKLELYQPKIWNKSRHYSIPTPPSTVDGSKKVLLSPVTAPSPARRRSRDELEDGVGSGAGMRPARRLIKVDFETLDDDDDDDNDEPLPVTDKCPPQPFPRSFVKASPTPIQNGGTAPKPWQRTTSPPRAPPRRVTHDEYHQFCDNALESYDLATQCPSRRASMRRHTIVACSKPSDSLAVSGTQSVPQSRPDSRQSGISGASSELDGAAHGTLGDTPNDISWSRNSLQEELYQSVSQTPSKKQWQDAMSLDERLSLTLEEIVHIRSVLTKAELEALPVEGRVKEDVEKRKVCFLCLKTRFGIFGPWGQRCKLCKKTVCTKCHSKMRIPTEHFSNVPVVLLSPSLMPSPDDETNISFPRSLMARLMTPEQHNDRTDNSVGSAPNSPSAQRSHPSAMARSLEGTLNTSPATQPPHSYVQSAPGSRGGSSLGYVPEPTAPLPALNNIMTRSMEGPQSLPAHSASPHHTLDRRNRFYRGATLGGAGRASDRLRGMQMVVCHDCKTMVLQIIKSSRTSRSATRNHAIRNLTLDLSPVYN